MFRLAGKTMVVIGGSRGVGRRVAESSARQGAQVLAVARREAPLRQLAQDVPGIEVLAIDATRPNAPSKVFEALVPDILVLSGGAIPVTAPLQEQSWRDFTVNWESDVRIAFQFCKAALSRPLPAGSSVILIASSAALAGSPLTGGYAGAKAHPDAHRKLQPERVRSPWTRLAICSACSRHHSGDRVWKTCGRWIRPLYWDVYEGLHSSHGIAANPIRRSRRGRRIGGGFGSVQGKDVRRHRGGARKSLLM